MGKGERERERKEEITGEREISHLLVHFPSGHDSLGCARSKPGDRSFIQLPVCVKDPRGLGYDLLPSQTRYQEAGLEMEPLRLELAPVLDDNIAGNMRTHFATMLVSGFLFSINIPLCGCDSDVELLSW